MELRMVEQELNGLSLEWQAARRKHAVDSDSGESLPVLMPPWSELKSKAEDDEAFLPEVEGGAIDTTPATIANKNEDADGVGGAGDGLDARPEDAAGPSEYGMCLAPKPNAEAVSDESATAATENGASVWERYAAKSRPKPKMSEPDEAEKSVSRAAVDDGESAPGEMAMEGASAEEILQTLEALQERVLALQPKVDKFLAKMNDRDPVTKRPRYGGKTLLRVKDVVHTHQTLGRGLAIAFHGTAASPGYVSSLRDQMQRDVERRNARLKGQEAQKQQEVERQAKEKILAEEQARRQHAMEEERQRIEEEQIARLAEETRARRLDEEQRALEEERRADRELLALVPQKGADGVREQIGRMREALQGEKAALGVALGSLHTLFEQIVRKPEEINFRRVRRDHPKFVEDIGRHVGGREVLIAARFKLEKIDGVPCFFSKEPHLESDMDGWSDWFDNLKKTLAVVEDEMLK